MLSSSVVNQLAHEGMGKE